jgi:cysteine desulfurase
VTPGGAEDVSVVYLDHAATSPLRPEARRAMEPWLGAVPANPAGTHRLARAARRALDDARDACAAALGCRPGELVFTSGGTEATNLAVRGVVASGAGRVLCTAVEHAAVLRPCGAVGGTTVPVDRNGRVDIEALAAALGGDVTLVAVMAANNEVGTVQPVPDAVATVRSRASRAAVLCDAVGASTWLDVPTLTAGCDLVAVAAHKVGGPVGVGALVVRQGAPWIPVLAGGAQERGRRPGTVPVALAVGMAAALTAAAAERAEVAARVTRQRDRLLDGLVAADCGVRPTVDRSAPTLPGHAHVVVDGVDAEDLLVLLDRHGICASAGAACASGAMEPSHVLLAMGLDAHTARRAVRFSLGPTTTDTDVAEAVRVVPELVRQLRG